LKQYLALQSTYHTFVLFVAQYYKPSSSPPYLPRLFSAKFSSSPFFCKKTMNTSLNFRSSQSLAATTSTSALRALLLGGLAVLGTAGTAMAQSAPSVKAVQGDGQALWLTVENPNQERMRLDVLCLKHDTFLTSETNRQASYGSKLNFGEVPAGKYAVLLHVGREHYRYNVEVRKGQQTTISVPELTATQAPAVVASATR
jgi:hypothetical protein